MDLVDRDDVSENAILEELRVRFMRNEIYSSIGPIIIALNPYRNIPDLYSSNNMNLYMESEHSPMGYHKHPPHVWTIAQSAFSHLKKTKASQAIVISGESGAGKTEATKKCLQYLSAIAQLTSGHSHSSKTNEVPVEDRVLETNPILESFGNSKTSRNNNSSRFGKWIDISFKYDDMSDSIQLVGAHITQYLLEKSRVVVQSTDERNYHIFYQLCSDPKWGLKNPSEYHYLNQSGCLQVEGVDDREEFHATLKSFDNLGFSEMTKNTILTALKAILLLGNVDILQNKAANAGDGTTSSRLIIIPPSSEKLLEEVAVLLGLPVDVFKVSVTIRSMTVRGETTRIPLDFAASMDCKNALAKEIYGRLFCQIVHQANVSLQPPGASGSGMHAPEDLLSIGLLDIFGFEKFKVNSFEQLCINYANEKLQQYFLNYVLKKEQELYDSEGIDYTKVVPIDNEDVLYLIEDRKKGIFVKLDDELKIPKSNDETFLKKIEQEHNSTAANRRFLKDIKMGKSQFEIRHFAGVIRYDVKGFMDKNKDRLFDHLEELLCESSNLPFRQIMIDHSPANAALLAAAANESSGGGSSGKSSKDGVTISSRFTSQLNKLMNVLDSSQPHFIKCIKPNNYKRPADYDLEMILLQLRYSGVLEAIMIRKSGYPTRRRHADFRKAYWMLARLSKMKLFSVGDDEERKCRMIVDGLAEKNPDQYGDIKVGKTLVFLKPNVLQVLEREKLARGALAVLYLQSAARRRRDARRCKGLVEGRARLRLCVKEGKLKNSGNVEAIPALKEAIDYCRNTIDLYCFEVRDAERLLSRLYEVQECLNQIKKFLSQQNNSSTASYNDVISEYTALNKILDTAVKLNIDESQLIDIRARVEVLKERASAVLNLRTAIDDGDEEALQKALDVIAGLKKVHGAFCDTDERYGREIQSKIKEENSIIMSSIQKFNEFHSAYQQKAEREGTQAWLSEGLALSSSAVKELMAPFMTTPAVCLVSNAAFKVLRILHHLHDYWGRKQWPSLGDTVVQLVNEKKALLEKQRSLSNPSPALAHMVALIDSYLSVVEADTNRHYLQPLLCESLNKGKAVGEVGRIDYNSIDFDSLAATVEEIKQFCWNGEKLKPLFHRLEMLVELRSACVEERVDSVLRLCTTSQQSEESAVRSREFNRQMSAIKKSLSYSDEFDESQDGSGENISDFVKALAARQQSYTAAGAFASIGDEFGSALQMIDAECAFIYADAIDKDIRKRVVPVLSVGSALQIDHMNDENRSILGTVVNSAPLSLLLREIDHIELRCASAGFKSVTSEVTVVLLKCVEMLLELRNLLISGDYDIVVELCEKNKLIVLSAIAEETDVSRQLLELSSFLMIKDEAIRIISISFNAVSIQLLLLSLRHGNVKGTVGRIDKSQVDFAMLEENMSYCQQHVNRLVEYGETMTEEFDTLKAMSMLVVEIRRSFLEPVRDVAKLKSLLEDLQSYTNVYVFPAEVEKEIYDLSRELEYDGCLQTIQKVFDVPASDIPYLVPFIKSRKRTISTSKNRSVGFDVTSTTAADGTVTVVQTQDDIEDILIEDERMLNDAAVETEEINVALYEVNQIKDIIPADQLPPEFEHMVLALELIKKMRELVKRGDWIQAQKVLTEILAANLPTLAPMIEREVALCGELVSNYAVIAACKSALLKNQPTGIIGQMDYKSISIEYMEEAILLCQSIGFKSLRAEAMFKALLIVTDLRRAQKVGDWGAIKAALQRAASENIGRGMTSLCLGEINRSVIEAENYDAIQQLKKAIILEEIFTRDCLLDLDHASIQILSESYQKAVQVVEDSRGAILKALISLTEVMLKSRKAAIQKNWTLLEDCISIVKDHLETFHNEIEKVDSNPKNKTHSFRASAITMTKSPPPRRGSLLAAASKDSPKPESESGSAFSSPVPHKISAWDEFAELNVSIKREIKSIELHFTVIELETAMTNALKEGGVKAEVIGKVDLKQIKVDALQSVLDTKNEMETFNSSLPASLKQKSKVVHLILDIRTAILQDKWEDVSRLLEISLDGQIGVLPEASRNEIAVVRLEIENKQIIHTLNNALLTGKLEGDVGKANLAGVSCEHLVHNISFCKSLQPRTTTAVLLLHTAEVMYEMRRLICNPDPKNTSPHVIKWAVVADKAKDIIAEVQNHRVHACVLPELRLFLATAEDTILCNAMTDALEQGGPTGQPGLLSIDGVSVVTLESACQLAIRSNNSVKTERVSQLFTACRTMKAIREALLRTSPPDTDRAEEAWNSIRELTASILEIRRKNPSDSSWSSCREELSLITKHAHIQQVRTSLIECIIKTSRIYAQRNTMNVSDTVPNTELLTSVEELDAIIAYSHQLDFENVFMTQYLECAHSLKMMRVAIADENWLNLKELISDRVLFDSLKVLPEAVQEFAWINCEFHNHMAFDIIKNALQPPKAESAATSPVKSPAATGSPSQQSSKRRSNSAADTLFDEHNKNLEMALKEVENYKITSKSTLQLLDCCSNVLLLRKSLKNNDNVQVAKCLRWFKANVHLCPPHVQLEAQESYVKHQNDLLTKELTKALQRGKPSGLRGELNLATIDTDSLMKLIEQSVDVVPKTAEVEDLLEAADIALTLRTAMRDRNIAGLKDVIDVLHIKDSGFNLLIVDEIATARGEVDNEIVVHALVEALKSFDDAESKALDMSFLNQTPEERENELSDNIEVPEVESQKPKMPGMSMLNSFSVRRYSFANKNNANIDPDTIDVEVLDRSIRVANDHGVYSIQARRLYRTVSLIRSLRSTMKASDWPKLQELVNEAKFDEHIDDLYDSLACKEMQAIKSQLEMRAAVVDLSKALKIGWAKCSNGIVNTSQLCNDVLANAIDRADRSITELSMKSDGEPLGDDVSPVQKQVQLLMTSAKLVLKIRDTLLNGNMEAAGALAHEGLSGDLHYSVVEELTLYTKEIDAALSTMSVFQALRAGMVKGNIKHLEKLIGKARALQSQYSVDLGLVRTLEMAMRTYDALLITRQALIQCTDDHFSISVIESTLDVARKLNLKSREVQYAQDKLDRLKSFEDFISELTLSNFGVLTERESFEQLVDKADELDLSKHPMSIKARVMLALTRPAFHTAALAAAFVHSSAYNVATETIQFKRMYLELSSSQNKYKLEHFKNLRAPEEFAMRMNISCEDLKKNMLQHSDQSLPTSLTLQSPVVAALSVWVFIHCIRGIEKQMYTTPEVMLAKLVQLGRTYIPMRDEILLQCIKQIRNNKDAEAARRVWRILSCCLYHFPPSLEFESYMELFLFIYAESSPVSSFSRQCIRFMHQSIFRYGYSRKIRTRLDKSTEVFQAWLCSTSTYYCPSHESETSHAHHAHHPSRFVDVFVDPAHDVAFRGYGVTANVAASTSSTDKSGPSTTAVKHHSIAGTGKKHDAAASGSAASAPSPLPSLPYCIRGTREDWISRFKQFNQDFGHKDGGHIGRKEFAVRLSQSTTMLGDNIDRVDKEVLFFLLFGKNIANRKSITRELHGDTHLLHFLSDDERATSEARRSWLEEHVTVAEKASELFFSQLKSSDLLLYAERFWDKIIDQMSQHCIHFPFFKWEGDESTHNKGKAAAAAPAAAAKEEKMDVMIGWELYREVILTGMKKYLEQEDPSNVTVGVIGGIGGGLGVNSRKGDISLKGYIMHSAEH